MTRILYFSDIHIEIRARYTKPRTTWTDLYPLQLGPDVSPMIGIVELGILAGDIGHGERTSDLSALLYAEQLAAFLEVPIVLVPGNHEYYGTEFFSARKALVCTNCHGITVLDRGSAIFPFPGEPVQILGATLWTDYKLLGDRDLAMTVARHRINDHRLITIDDRPFLPSDADDEHQASRAWIAACLPEPFDGKTIVVTHHVPHPAAKNPRFAEFDALSPAFLSDCSDLLDAAAAAGISAWIFGHHHACIDMEHRGVKLLSAQWGYPREETGWTGPGILFL